MYTFFVIFSFFISIISADWYWGNHCGREANNRYAPVMDAFDAACYRHDRCLESRIPDWLCSVQVGVGLYQASAQSGRSIPWQIFSGFAHEHGWGKKKR